ncbi:MAG: leucine-rich repeat domain-containing protein [Ruminococcus flavefaciens]|nr:leucine-rich repeat domain-containing protein [Ruminococcus flavefaciens]
MNDNEKIENLEKEIQSLKGIIEILAKDAKFSPVKAVSTPERPPIEVFEEESFGEPEEIIDIFPTEYAEEDFDIEDGLLHEYLGDSKEVTIPYGVTKIGNGAFRNNKKIQKVNFSDTVMEIGTQAFAGCDNLVKINLPYNLKTIGTEAFAKCANLVTVNISGNDVIIGSKAFSECRSLEKIDIENVKEICSYAFLYCTSLKRLRFTENTEKIGSFAFNGCSNLKISVPETCKYYSFAFNGCKNVVVREVIK